LLAARELAMPEETAYDFFIAHAGPDQAEAEELYDFLAGQVRVFLDTKCLRPGDIWPLLIQNAQRSSRVSVVLISDRTERAFYEGEEIATAIVLARDGPAEHRVVPVYLSGPPPLAMPYGLRQMHAISVTDITPIRHVASQLMDLHRFLASGGKLESSGLDSLGAAHAQPSAEIARAGTELDLLAESRTGAHRNATESTRRDCQDPADSVRPRTPERRTSPGPAASATEPLGDFLIAPRTASTSSRPTSGVEKSAVGLMATGLADDTPARAHDVRRRDDTPAAGVVDRDRGLQAESAVGSMFRRPRLLNDFAGRDDEMRMLDSALASSRSLPGPVVVVITGGGGIGKTTLVRQWLAGALDQGEIQRDQFYYLDLRGYPVSGAVTPNEALEDLLIRLGVAPAEIPGHISERSKRFSELAADRYLLGVLDNAVDGEHVRDLLPRDGHSLVVLISRGGQFEGLWVRDGIDITSIHLGRLPHDKSLEMLQNAIDRDLTDDRDAVETVIHRCSGLPLALKIAAALVRSDQYTVTGLARRLDALDTELPTLLNLGDKATDLGPVFETSYSSVSEDARRAFRLLGLRHAQGIDSYAISLLAGVTIADADRLIRELKNFGLVAREQDSDRVSVHDLLHGFARDLLKSDDEMAQRAAVTRMIDGYYGCVNYVFDAKNDNNPMVDAEYLKQWLQGGQAGKNAVDTYVRFGGDAAKWFAAERENLVGLVRRACAMRPVPGLAPALAFSMFYSLEASGHWTEWDEITKVGLQAAQAAGDTCAEASLTRNMGRLELVRVRDRHEGLSAGKQDDRKLDAFAGQCRLAIRWLQQSARLYRSCLPGRPRQAAAVERELADVYLELAQLDKGVSFRRAVRAYRRAERLFRREDDWENPVASMNVSLSIAYREMRKYSQAAHCLDDAQDYARPAEGTGKSPNPRVWAFALLRRAELCLAYGQREDAIAWYEEAANAFRSDNGWLFEARTRARTGRLLAEMDQDGMLQEGRKARALDLMTQAYGVLEEQSSGEAAVVKAWIDQLTSGSSAGQGTPLTPRRTI